ncbi:MAG: hypothetical protein JWO82_3070 [Akkermansiaceae bacterium]|nr:hypothetical protein [Akkermansiaceae bacterium]
MKSPSLPSWSLSAGGLVLALAAGIMIGRTSSAHGGGGSTDNSAAAAGSDRSGPGEGGSLSERAARRKGSATARSSPEKTAADLQAIMESASRLERTQKLLAFLDRLPTDQFGDVYGSMRDMPGANLHGSERSLILQAWAERDPLAAVGFLQQKGADDWERETAVSTWASKDPESAFAWALAAPDEGKVNNWQLGAARGIAATNPELARDYLTKMEGDTRDRALGAMQPYVMQYGFDYATNWISGVGDGGLRGRAENLMARDLTNLDPARAGQWNAAITDVNTRRDVSETVSDAWARTDLNSAKAWVESLPQNTKTEAAEGVARQYAQQDPQQAAKWLAGLGNDPDLDGARRIFVEESYGKSPQASLDFVSNISDAKAREGYYWREVSRWMKDDATSARTWIAKNSNVLPPQLVQRLNGQ